MAGSERNILSDPTSDGNFHEESHGAVAIVQEQSPPPSYRCEDYDYRRGMNKQDNDSLTQTCPTCGGSGKLTKEQEHDLVALIPVRDRRLKPRRTVLYLVVAVFICLTVSILVGVFLFPRNISIHLASALPVNVNMPKSNKTDPFILINSTISINNSNFFEAVIDGFSIEVNWESYVVANPDFDDKVKVPARSVVNHTFYVKTTYAKQEAIKIRTICCGWSFNLAFLITVSAKTHSLTVSSEASDYGLKYINCQLYGGNAACET